MRLVLIIVLFIAAFCAWRKLAEAKKKKQRKLDKILSEYDFEKKKAHRLSEAAINSKKQ